MTPLKYDNFLVIVSVSVALHAFPMDPTPFKSVFTYQKSFTLGLPTLMECKRQKTASLKKERGMQSFVTQDILAETGKKKATCQGEKKETSLLPPEYGDFIVCDTGSAVG